jgi:hypothetical protein
MLVSEIVHLHHYPDVRAFFRTLIDMQFGDVRAMLQLPRPDIGITPGCNFAIVSSLCNLLSGISTTVYKPSHLLHEVTSPYHSGPAFRDLVRDFYPYTPPGAADFPAELYRFARNPLAHSVGLTDADVPLVGLTRVLSPSHPDSGWTDHELTDLESGQYSMTSTGIVTDGQNWTVYCDSFYFDVINLLRRLTDDANQMQAAERRFRQGVYNWRRA